MKIALSVLLIVAGLASGCAKAPPSGPPPKNNGSNVTSSTLNVSTNQSTGTDNSSAANLSPNATDPAAAGADFVNNILASFLPSSGWTPPLPPSGGQKPRALTQQEKDRLLQITNSFQTVVNMKNNPDVVGIYSNFLWVEWIGHADGEGFLNYGPVEKGTVNVSNKSDNWFPAADFIFQSRFSRLSAVGIHVAVNLETGKVVWSGGYVTVLPETVSNTSLNVPQISNLFIAMNNVGTMSGVVRQLTISNNGSVVYVEQTGMRIKLPGGYVTKTVKTGLIEKESIDRLRGMVDAIPFDGSGNFQAGTHTMDTAVLSSLSVNLSGVTRVIYSNFDPLYFDAALIPDVPPSVQMLYHELWDIAQHQTTQVSSEKIY